MQSHNKQSTATKPKYQRRTKPKRDEVGVSRSKDDKLEGSLGQSRDSHHRYLILTENNSHMFRRDLAHDESRIDEQREENTKFVADLQEKATVRHKKLEKMNDEYKQK